MCIYKCKICNHELKGKTSMIWHIVTNHFAKLVSPNGNKKYVCNHANCNLDHDDIIQEGFLNSIKTLFNRSELKSHLMNYHNININEYIVSN